MYDSEDQQAADLRYLRDIRDTQAAEAAEFRRVKTEIRREEFEQDRFTGAYDEV